MSHMSKHRYERWVRGLAGTGIAVSALSSTPAQAYGAEIRGDIGAFIGYRFGGSSGGLTWGLEARSAVNSEHNCSGSAPVPYYGSLLRLGFESGLRPFLGLGLLGGTYLGGSSLAGLQAGMNYDFGPSGGFTPWLAAEVGASHAVLRFDYLPVQGGIAPTIGARLLPSNEMNCYVIGRPHRTESGIAALPHLQLAPDEAAEDVGDLRETLVELWGQRARTEWAAAPAFLELSTHLAAAGAPSGLVGRSLQAADDEIRHGVVSAQVTARFDGGRVQLHPQPDLPRLPERGEKALIRLAQESWLDGCLQEGTAAACAAAEARATRDSGIRLVQEAIASDEAEHAALAWDVIDWAISLGGAPVREALAAIRDVDSHRDYGEVPNEVAEYGIMGPRLYEDIASQVRLQARAELERRLAG